MSNLCSHLKFLVLSALSRLPNSILEACILQLNRSLGRGYVSQLDAEVEHLISFTKDLEHSNLAFLDIGANIGEYTSRFHSKNLRIPIYSFEPSHNAFLLMKSRFANIKDITICNFALGDKNGTSLLHYDKVNSGLASLAKRNLEHLKISFNLYEEVQVRRLHSFAKELNLLDKSLILKIDVEGFEMSVLKGLGRLIEKNVLIIQFEFGGANLDSRSNFQELWRYFLKFDFDLWRLTPSGVKKVERYIESFELPLNTTYYAVKKDNS